MPEAKRASMATSAFTRNDRDSKSGKPWLMPEITNLIDINELSRRLSIARGTLNCVCLRRIPFIKAGRCLRFNAVRWSNPPTAI
jgi:hypothetical protein